MGGGGGGGRGGICVFVCSSQYPIIVQCHNISHKNIVSKGYVQILNLPQ